MDAAEQEVIPCDKHRLLIVDDEKAIRAVFKQILSFGLKNCRIDLAVNGAEAVEFFRTVHHGVILMDLKMPVMDGETAFTTIQEMCEQEGWEMPAVVFITGFSASPYVRKVVANSRTHHLLHKPVASDVLVEVLKSHLPDSP